LVALALGHRGTDRRLRQFNLHRVAASFGRYRRGECPRNRGRDQKDRRCHWPRRICHRSITRQASHRLLRWFESIRSQASSRRIWPRSSFHQWFRRPARVGSPAPLPPVSLREPPTSPGDAWMAGYASRSRRGSTCWSRPPAK